MSETYLQGALVISSLAAPTAEDAAKLAALTPAQRRAVLAEALEAGRTSGISTRSAEDILAAAKARAAQVAGHDV